jgi:Tol biopolymer transport system component
MNSTKPRLHIWFAMVLIVVLTAACGGSDPNEARSSSILTDPTATGTGPTKPAGALGYASPEDALIAMIGPENYLPECRIDEGDDVFKTCFGLDESTDTTRRYWIGGPGSEPSRWVLVERQPDGSWLVTAQGALPPANATPVPPVAAATATVTSGEKPGKPPPATPELPDESGMAPPYALSLAPGWSPDGNRIGFLRIDQQGIADLYTMNADGSQVTRLAGTVGGATMGWGGGAVAWAPDGSRIAFVRDGDIYVVNIDGTGETRLTEAAGAVTPVWAPGHLIAFVSTRDGNEEIYTVAPDGSVLTNLTANPAADIWPAWSPDGTRLAFASSRRPDGMLQIHVMQADGSSVTPIGDRYGVKPLWSVDGSRIAHVSDGDYWIMNLDGTGLTRITSEGGAGQLDVSWSPDGTRLAVTSISGSSGIYIVSADGSTRTLLARSGWQPAWSPNGAQIAFVSIRDAWDEVYVIGIDGTGETRLTTGGGTGVAVAPTQLYAATPTWSPDGRQIAFGSNRDGSDEVYVINVDGSGLTQLTTDGGSMPLWSPNGRWIAFLRHGAIWVMRADGSGQVSVMGDLGFDGPPLWSPDGDRLAFSATDANGDDIYVVNADGSRLVNVSNTPGPDFFGSWSPDGSRITFFSKGPKENQAAGGMFIASVDGSRVEQVAAMPFWSPDPSTSSGQVGRIAVERDGNLYVARADGSAEVQVASGGGSPVWSPNGERIAYISRQDGAIHVVNADGSGDVRIAQGGAWPPPSWSPDGTQLLIQRDNQLLVASADGSGVSEVPGPVSAEYQATWSPDPSTGSGRASRIAFVSDRDGRPEIYVVDVGSMQVTRLTVTAP